MGITKHTCPICEEDVEVVWLDGMIRRFVIHGDCPGGFAQIELATTNLESRYTPPTEYCPQPGRWHSTDWDSAEHEVSELVAAFVTALRPDLVLETGTAFGQTAYEIGAALHRAGEGKLDTLEPSAERCEIARKRCTGLPVTVHQISSLDYTPSGDIGFAWFDSLIGLRVPEFQRFRPWLKPGSFVGFHDTAPHQGALWDEISDLETDGHLLAVRLPTPRGVVFAEVL